MASNRFDTSQQQEYTSQYVPLPFEAISAMGEKADKNFAEGEKAVNDLGVLGAAIKAAPMHQDDRTKFINNYNTKVKTLIDEAKGDYGSSDFKTKVNTLTNEFKNEPKLQAFIGTLDAYKEYEKRKTKEGGERDLDYTYEKNPDGSFKQVDVLEKGKYSTKFTKYEDWNKAGKEVMGNIAKSGYNEELGLDFNKPTIINNGETKVYSNRERGYVGVSDPRVKALSNFMVGEYANTNAGKHHLQSLLGQDIDYLELSSMAQSGNEQAIKAKAAVDQEFENHLYRSNANQIGGVKTDKISYMNVTDRSAEKANDAKEKESKRKAWDVINLGQATKDDFNTVNPHPDLFTFNSDGSAKVAPLTMESYYKGADGKNYVLKDIPLVPGLFKDPTKTKGLAKLVDMNGTASIYNNGKLVTTVRTTDNTGKPIKNEGLNVEMIKKKVQVSGEYLRATGQYEEFIKKFTNKDGTINYTNMYDAGLLEIANSIKKGHFNNQALPIFDEKSSTVLTKRILPSYNEKGEIINPGLISSASIVDENGKTVSYSNDDKLTIFKGAKITAPSFIGGDIIKATLADGSIVNIKLNNPDLKYLNEGVTSFISNTNKAITTPPSLAEQQEKTKEFTLNTIDQLNKNQNNPNLSIEVKQDFKNRLENYINTVGDLNKKGYTEVNSYILPDGSEATSYVNYKSKNRDVKVLVHTKDGQLIETNLSSVASEAFQNNYQVPVENADIKSTKLEDSTFINQ
jgi:hypothetical protein